MAENTPSIEEFLNSLTGLSDKTREAYGYALALFESTHITLDSDVLRNFNTELDKRKYAKSTRMLYITALKRYLGWLDAMDKLPAALSRSKADERLRAVQSRRARESYHPKEIDRRLPEIIAFYDNQELPENQNKRLELLRSRAIMHTLYSSAGRVSEITSLTRAQVADGQADQATTIGKGNKPRTMFFTREAQAAIRAYCNARQDTYPALFISHGRNKGRPLTRARVWQTVKLAVRTLGISTITSPHSFRHYRATQLLNEGMSLEFVQEYLGHSSPATTRIVYAQVNKRVLKEQLNEFGLSPKEALKQALYRANKE